MDWKKSSWSSETWQIMRERLSWRDAWLTIIEDRRKAVALANKIREWGSPFWFCWGFFWGGDWVYDKHICPSIPRICFVSLISTCYLAWVSIGCHVGCAGTHTFTKSWVLLTQACRFIETGLQNSFFKLVFCFLVGIGDLQSITHTHF